MNPGSGILFVGSACIAADANAFLLFSFKFRTL